MTSSKTNYVLKASLPNKITLGIGASTYKFWDDTNIQSTTGIPQDTEKGKTQAESWKSSSSKNAK